MKKSPTRVSGLILLCFALLTTTAGDVLATNLLKKIRGNGAGDAKNEPDSDRRGIGVKMSEKNAIPVVVFPNKASDKKYRTFAIGSAFERDGFDFSYSSSQLSCSRMIADAISQRLTENINFTTVTREHVQRIFEEHDLNWGGRFDTTSGSQLGKLLGAEVLIFAKANYCEKFPDEKDGNKNNPYGNLQANAQSNNVGDLAESAAHALGASKIGGAIGLTKDLIAHKRQKKSKALGDPHFARLHAMVYAVDLTTGEKIMATSGTVNRSSEHEAHQNAISGDLLMYQAADEIAADFVDRLLGRPEFGYVQMYKDSFADVKDGIRLVRLGDCQAAAEQFDKLAVHNVYRAQDRTNGKILHNHGIALMCAGRLTEAQSKFRASYRLLEAKETLDMINLSHLLEERDWSMAVEEDSIIRMLVGYTKAQDSSSSASPTVSRDPSASGAQ